MSHGKRFYRPIFILLVVLSALAVPTALLAQADMPKVICDRLSDEDCLLLQRSRQAMNEVTTARSHSESLFQLVDIPSMVMDGEPLEIPELAISVTLDNAYAFDERTAEQWQALAAIDQNVMGLAALVAPESILQIFAGLTAEMTLRLQLSEAVQVAFVEELGEPLPAEMVINVRVIDNMLYIDLNAIADALDALPPPAAWGVVNLDDLWALPATSSDNPPPATIFAFLVGAVAARNNDQLITYYEDLQLLGALDRKLAPGRVVQVVRGEDQIVHGITVAEYRSTIDVRRLVSWGATVVQQFLDGLGEEVDPEVTVALTMGPSLLTGVESTFTAYIEPATARVHRQENAFVWDFTALLSMANLLASQSGTEFQVDSAAGQQPQLVMRTETEFDYATPVIVEVPDDVIAVPLDEVFGQE
ncbi:MAG TPA: hypothetical protein P5121_27750 [Caldilineaceae bacterium]|nr:hypothetical protein [Caldilineaceae bacterium]